jgi:hypothetical protein
MPIRIWERVQPTSAFCLAYKKPQNTPKKIGANCQHSRFSCFQNRLRLFTMRWLEGVSYELVLGSCCCKSHCLCWDVFTSNLSASSQSLYLLATMEGNWTSHSFVQHRGSCNWHVVFGVCHFAEIYSICLQRNYWSNSQKVLSILSKSLFFPKLNPENQPRSFWLLGSSGLNSGFFPILLAMKHIRDADDEKGDGADQNVGKGASHKCLLSCVKKSPKDPVKIDADGQY